MYQALVSAHTPLPSYHYAPRKVSECKCVDLPFSHLLKVLAKVQEGLTMQSDPAQAQLCREYAVEYVPSTIHNSKVKPTGSITFIVMFYILRNRILFFRHKFTVNNHLCSVLVRQLSTEFT